MPGGPLYYTTADFDTSDNPRGGSVYQLKADIIFKRSGGTTYNNLVDLLGGDGGGSVYYIDFALLAPGSSVGPVLDHSAETASFSSTGPVSDEFVGALAAGYGPTFDHDVQAFPSWSTGPITDDFTDLLGNTKHGPVFDHVAQAIIVPNTSFGPIYDSFPTPIRNQHGPVLDGNVSMVPPLLDISDPDAIASEPIRNTLEPQLVEFVSPNAYGLEKDPTTGTTVGFKY